MLNTLKALMLRHFKSEGFQRRLKNLYIPVLKQLLTKPYRYFHAKYVEHSFAEEYQGSKDIQLDDEGANELPEKGYSAEGLVLTEEDAIELFKEQYQLDHESQSFGTCVAHTMKNIHRFACKACWGGVPNFSEHDVYIDRYTRAQEIDGGMSPSKTLDRMIEKGIAIEGIVPTATEKEDLNIDRDDYPDIPMQPFRVKMLARRGYIAAEKDFEPLWAFLVETYNKRGVRPFQFSIFAMSGWWGNDVPTATGKNYGGHSVMGLTIPFMFGSKRAFLAVDSSYRKGTSWRVARGVRIVTEDCWRGLGRAFRPVEFVPQIESRLLGKPPVATNPIPPSIPTTPIQKKAITKTAQFGQSGDNVTEIQKALIEIGFTIPAITSGSSSFGYYGQQTADAVLAFHRKYVSKFTEIDPYWNDLNLGALKGRSFGALSVAVINKIRGV